jgi:hypothetical protein
MGAAKRKKKSQRKPPLDSSRIKTENTGIFERKVLTVHADDPEGEDVWSELEREHFAKSGDIDSILRELLKHANDVKSDILEENWEPKRGDSAGCLSDAYMIIGHIYIVLDAIAKGDPKRAAAGAYWLGRAAERLSVRHVEPSAKTGKRTRESLSSGREAL